MGISCPSQTNLLALYAQCFLKVCDKNLLTFLGGIQIHDFLLSSADILTNIPHQSTFFRSPPLYDHTSWFVKLLTHELDLYIECSKKPSPKHYHVTGKNIKL